MRNDFNGYRWRLQHGMGCRSLRRATGATAQHTKRRRLTECTTFVRRDAKVRAISPSARVTLNRRFYSYASGRPGDAFCLAHKMKQFFHQRRAAQPIDA